MPPDTGGSVLRGVLRAQRGPVTAGVLLLMAHQVFEALVPVVVGRVIDRAVDTGDDNALVGWILVLVVLFAALSSAYRFGARRLETAEQAGIHHLVAAVTRRVLDPRGGVQRGAGDLASVATSDATRATAIVGALAVGAGGLAAVTVATVSLLLISVPLGLLVVLGLPPVLAAVQLLARPLERRLRVQQEQAAQAAAVAGDLVSGFRVLAGLGAGPAAADRYRAASRDSLAAALHASWPESVHRGLSVAVTGLTVAATALVGGRLAADGRITVGDLVAAVGLVAFLVGPLLRLGLAGTEFAAARASATRVAQVLATPPAVVPGRAPVPSPAGGLVLRGLRTDELPGLDLEIAPGTLVGVVAGSAAQAADLLAVLARDRDDYDGAVSLHGVELRHLELESLRRHLVVSGHHSYLFEGTVADNVRAGGDAVEAALAAAGADDLARILPGGYDAVVSERGRSLSGGQRQRVALARALATMAPILVLHDPTTAIDAATEARIAAGLRRLRTGLTTVLLTSSPALLAVTDRTVLLDGGILADGRHAELLDQHAGYRALVTG